MECKYSRRTDHANRINVPVVLVVAGSGQVLENEWLVVVTTAPAMAAKHLQTRETAVIGCIPVVEYMQL